MKIGILGTGMIVKDFMNIIHELKFESIYLLGTESTREETENMAQTNQLDGTFYDYDELLQSDADTIYVALPNFLHYSFGLKALKAGKNVILEKPGTSNAKEMAELIRIAKEKNLFLFEAMSLLHAPAYKEVKKNIARLGDLKIVSLNYSQYSRRYDAFKEGTVLPVFDPKKAGGALMDLNVYNVHFLLGLFGKPLSVSYHANIEKGIDTSGILTLDYGTFQAVSIAAKDCKAPVMCSLQGDKGCLRISRPVNGMTAFDVDMNDGSTFSYADETVQHRMIYEFEEFIRCADENDHAANDVMMNLSLAAAEVLTEARKSAGIVFPADL